LRALCGSFPYWSVVFCWLSPGSHEAADMEAVAAGATLVEVAGTRAEAAGISEAERAAFRAEDFGAAVDFAEPMQTVAADFAEVTAGTLVLAETIEAVVAADSAATTAGRIIIPGFTPATTIRSGGIPTMSIPTTIPTRATLMPQFPNHP